MKTLAYRLLLIGLIPAFLLALIVAGMIQGWLMASRLFREMWQEARHA